MVALMPQYIEHVVRVLCWIGDLDCDCGNPQKKHQGDYGLEKKVKIGIYDTNDFILWLTVLLMFDYS